MSTVTQPPAVPPRPSRSLEKDDHTPPGGAPLVPPRPNKSRSKSPSMDRYAPSPLNDEGFHAKSPPHPKPSHLGSVTDAEEAIDRSGSVNMPSLGEEGAEYAAVTEELEEELREEEEAGSPGETRTVGDDVKLHAPKPSLPAASAKQRVMAVTRTDSNQAASFGIGKAGSESARPKSISSQGSGDHRHNSQGHHHSHGHHEIPEIGIQVPMLRDAGDVQAPTPANDNDLGNFRTNSRGPPPGSYGMHGHGIVPEDKLEQAYYEKHPERYKHEHLVQLHDRKHDFNLSSDDLNRIVRDSANHGSGLATHDFAGTPSEEVGFQASDEYATRIATPHHRSPDAGTTNQEENTIHIDDPSPSQEDSTILASDEVQKHGPSYGMHPAVEPPLDTEKPVSPPSHPASLASPKAKEAKTEETKETKAEEAVTDDEPLFQDEKDSEATESASARNKHHFPSKDVWEDSPQSVHYTATVSTPDVDQGGLLEKKRQPSREDAETPQQAFARRFEAQAEQEADAAVDPFTDHRKPATPQTVQPHQEKLQPSRPAMGNRFPSKDVWEDAPESHMYQTTVSAPQQQPQPQEENPPVPPQNRPAVPARPQPKPKPVFDERMMHKPLVADKPKPPIPVRPSKLSSSTTPAQVEELAPKPKPVVPQKFGGKIAALQAGFMSDLNKRLQIGPQVPKKEEPPAQDTVEEVKERVPLSDARKGRARGPQRRAPARSPAAPVATAGTTSEAAPKAHPAEAKALSFTFSMPVTSWAIDPEHGALSMGGAKEESKESKSTESKESLVSETAKESEESTESVFKTAQEPPESPVESKEPKESKDSTESVCKTVEESTESAETPVESKESPSPTKSPIESEESPESPIESKESPGPQTEHKTLVANMAGEPILEADVKHKGGVEPVTVDDSVESS